MLSYLYQKGDKNMIERNNYLNLLKAFKDKDLIKVVSGIRRCGKSTLFVLYQEFLKQNGILEEQIININLEDGNYRDIKETNNLYDLVASKLIPDKKNYVFLDEVQQVKNFEKACDSLYIKKNVDLYITGSNAYLLSGELATLLAGRYVEIKMMPLSFNEYISALGNSELQTKYNNYITNSSFPYTLELENKETIKAYLDSIYNSIILKDVVARKNITDISLLDSIIRFIFDNIGSFVSATKIANTATSYNRKASVHTIENYIDALVKSFVLYKVNRYDIKGKQYLNNNPKYYICDVAFKNYLLGDKKIDFGHILENVVYLELIRRGYEVYVGKIGENEIDFIAFGENGKEYYQVAYTAVDENTLKRELTPLNLVNDHNQKFLLTMDILPRTSHNGIKQINVLEWLLNI
jgi:predicted AAA+ superfamily ATPase